MSTINNNNYLKFPHKTSKDGPVSKALKFLLTDRGRSVIYYATGAVTLGVTTALLCKETFFIEQYLNLFQVYDDGFPLEVPEHFEERIDACMDKAKLSAMESTKVKSFMVKGFETRSFGSSKSNYNGYIGIPINYLYESINDVDKVNVKLGEKSIDWNSKYGQLLKNSLVLTEDEKEFGLLKTTLELRNNNFQHGTLIPCACIFGLYTISQSINRKLGLYHRPRPLRLFVYTILCTFVYGIYSMITNVIRIRQNVGVDKGLAELGPEMCETGVRFYEKILNKNIATRELSGDHSTYTKNGNEHPGWMRWSKLALSTRKLYFEQMLDEARKKEAEEAKKIAEQTNETDDKVKE